MEKDLAHIGWKEFRELDLYEKGAYLNENGRALHTLIAQQFSREMLERVCELSDKVRQIAKAEEGRRFLLTLCADKRIMLYFAQPSSRTFLSFYNACQLLGVTPCEVRDSSTSSEVKGESSDDTVRTFCSYVDMIIMRHPIGGFAERVAWMLSQESRRVPLLNAGSGKDQHPTQALLDIYTLSRSFKDIGGIDGKSVMFVGDLLRGRTVRSLVGMLRLYEDVKLYFVAPQELQIGQDILDMLDASDVSYELSSDMEKLLPMADAVYMTRIQDEWDAGNESSTLDVDRFHFMENHLSLIKETCILMHPLPRRKEIDVAVDSDPRAMYWPQVRNGMWCRAALVLQTFGRDGLVDNYFENLK
jgi:aspartate carbamoyltransferase catalytic subunit